MMGSEDTKLAGMQSETLAGVTAEQHRRVLLNTLTAARERIAALESVLRELVSDTSRTNGMQCAYCGEHHWFSQRYGHQPEQHAPDCPVMAARALLDKS